MHTESNVGLRNPIRTLSPEKRIEFHQNPMNAVESNCHEIMEFSQFHTTSFMFRPTHHVHAWGDTNTLKQLREQHENENGTSRPGAALRGARLVRQGPAPKSELPLV